MKTKFFAAIITAFMFVSMANAQTTKIGYTNVDYILNNLPDAKDIENKLKTEKAQYDKLLQDKITAFQTKYEDYQKNGATMSAVIRADREKELQSAQTAIQEFQQNSESALQQKQQQLLAPVLEKIDKTVKDVAKENGYVYVFNTDAGPGTTPILLVAPDADNISDLVFKKLGVTPPAKAAAQTTPAAPAAAPKK
ncbi:outer membrane chaperone Skp (OmpH) [Emticicia oligotrophica DSM 17448]|uniref:Outer membrane chaperone Skp (OmpH) n=1 Tax=Emticicia oligotrophica (strain DSM 17448 / CIP 109782 / MTCC 6937 / GPTSA100-15) TaxID=929562 RepID=A0ABN4ALB9_EMTOG|nr:MULTISPECIES: OmpH family outer membrane protein [Emticicia]AFK02934.1 outer membrane chaperone Skp (OmpH) [Emticicia oligotrophica DSM 17448]